ncbi:hypothetical protein [Robertmurraya sp.]|uniref:hypothetical protein n=1 Tax=Robertmurraya sp. TaxID=2837525 RepID=UPI0037042E3C
MTSNPYSGYENPYDPDSIHNEYGKYGSPYSPNSVMNPIPLFFMTKTGTIEGNSAVILTTPDSISNPYGRYGNPYLPDSINNLYGARNPYDSGSPTNPYGSGWTIRGTD